jgi:hypothetical protein
MDLAGSGDSRLAARTAGKSQGLVAKLPLEIIRENRRPQSTWALDNGQKL